MEVPFGGAYNTYSIALEDVNGDGALDIIQGNIGQSYVYLNDGHGGFSTGVPFGGANFITNGIALGDVNGDGKLDLVVVDPATNKLVVLQNKTT